MCESNSHGTCWLLKTSPAWMTVPTQSVPGHLCDSLTLQPDFKPRRQTACSVDFTALILMRLTERRKSRSRLSWQVKNHGTRNYTITPCRYSYITLQFWEYWLMLQNFLCWCSEMGMKYLSDTAWVVSFLEWPHDVATFSVWEGNASSYVSGFNVSFITALTAPVIRPYWSQVTERS
jgi:hypothetical protein